MPAVKRIHVVAAVIENANDDILIAKRPLHVHQGGLWEFPGGKVEEDESIEIALARELQEELGILPVDFTPLIQIAHDYPDKSVLLDVWRVSRFEGNPTGAEGQTIRWVNKNSLADYSFPDANKPIITSAILPNKYLITPEPDLTALDSFLLQLDETLRQGITLLQLRAKLLNKNEFRNLYFAAKEISDSHGTKLIPNCSIEMASSLKADAIHLSSNKIERLKKVPDKLLVSAACHNEKEMRSAIEKGCHFLLLSPVNRTQTHPDVPALGWEKFALLCQRSTVPVFALGGMSHTDISKSIAYGGQGIAAIRSLWIE